MTTRGNGNYIGEVLGVGGARVVLNCPDLGPGSGHQILKVGDAEQTQEEAFFFGKIARDFSYVTRPPKAESPLSYRAMGLSKHMGVSTLRSSL